MLQAYPHKVTPERVKDVSKLQGVGKSSIKHVRLTTCSACARGREGASAAHAVGARLLCRLLCHGRVVRPRAAQIKEFLERGTLSIFEEGGEEGSGGGGGGAGAGPRVGAPMEAAAHRQALQFM